MREVEYRRAMHEIGENGIKETVYFGDEKLHINGNGKISENLIEKEERKALNKEQLIAGLKQITALFEEADGIWINLQGKDRKKRLEKQEEKCKKENKEFNPRQKVKTELKLHVMHEGWKKGDKRHSLVNKQCIAGIMKPKEIKELRDAKVYEQYEVVGEENVKRNKKFKDSFLATGKIKGEVMGIPQSHTEHKFMKGIMKMNEFSEMSFIKSYKAY